MLARYGRCALLPQSGAAARRRLARLSTAAEYAQPDRWTEMARREGYPARSVYKLKEANQKYRLLHPGFRVLDLGSAPGSWLLFAAQQVGSTGFALGVDVAPLAEGLQLPPNAHFHQADLMQWRLPDELCRSFNVVLSDAAPKTTGDPAADAESSIELAERALTIARVALRPRGRFFVKVFEGQGVRAFRSELSHRFESVRIFRPASTRRASVEIFLFAKGFKPLRSAGTAEAQAQSATTNATP
jgi:23S rRNA (uridine2552-2'-O)-methyltransferase